jgi:hypothetical protein
MIIGLIIPPITKMIGAINYSRYYLLVQQGELTMSLSSELVENGVDTSWKDVGKH